MDRGTGLRDIIFDSGMVATPSTWRSNVFEDLFTLPRVLKKHRTGPFVAERARYLAHLKKAGARRSTLIKCANDLLHVVHLLKNQSTGGPVSMPQIEAAAAKWARPKGRRWARPASRKARVRFISGAVRWFEFLGWIKAIEQPRNSGGARSRHPYAVRRVRLASWRSRVSAT